MGKGEVGKGEMGRHQFLPQAKTPDGSRITVIVMDLSFKYQGLYLHSLCIWWRDLWVIGYFRLFSCPAYINKVNKALSYSEKS
jgi:hypothetical protein